MKKSMFYRSIFPLASMLVILVSGAIYPDTQMDTTRLTMENTQAFVNLNNGWRVVYRNDNRLNPSEINFRDAIVVSSDSLFNNVSDVNITCYAFKYLNVDSILIGVPLTIGVYQSGTLTLFVGDQGPYEFGYNSQGKIRDNRTVVFDSADVYRLYIAFRNPEYKTYINSGITAGIYMYISGQDYFTANELDHHIFNTSFQMFFTSFLLAFAILHLVLFIYLRELKSNLYFLLFLLFYAMNVYFDFEAFMGRHVLETLLSLRLHRFAIPFTSIFILKFLYSLFPVKQPRYFYAIVILLLVSGGLAVYAPVSNLWIINTAVILSTLEVFRILIIANKEKYDGAKIVSFGFAMLFIFSLYDTLNDMDVVGAIGRLTNAYMFGATGLIVCISVYLAKQFALTNRKLAEEAAERVVLESDNQRKTWELEEARKLQLSLLPHCGNELPGYDVCFSMRTATEVGGDYYDYMITNDNTLTVVIGDATGHGMKAGNMVVLIKSLFNTMGHTFYIPDFFNHCTRQIKKMNFGNLFMSMTMVKLRGNNVVVSSAGMPPVLMYKKELDEVEEVIIKGMPLGAHDQFPYQEKMDSLKTGDVLLLLSDGIIELFNSSRQMHGMKRVKDILTESYEMTPSEIVERLYNSCDNWLKGRPQNDDITFVVLKKK